MTQKAVEMMGTVFSACLQWLDSLLSAVQGEGFIIAGILIVFITSLFLMPLRGGSIAISRSITDFTASAIHTGKHESGRWKLRSSGKGKYEKGNTVGRVIRQRNLRK